MKANLTTDYIFTKSGHCQALGYKAKADTGLTLTKLSQSQLRAFPHLFWNTLHRIHQNLFTPKSQLKHHLLCQPGFSRRHCSYWLPLNTPPHSPLRISFCVAKRRVKLDNYSCFMWFSKVKGLGCGGQLVLAWWGRKRVAGPWECRQKCQGCVWKNGRESFCVFHQQKKSYTILSQLPLSQGADF